MLGAVVDRYVTPGRRYLRLHGDIFRSFDDADRATFGHALARDARQITERELDQLLNYEWRAQLTAAWLIGLTRRDHCRDRIGELLLASRLCNAGKGFCFALARFATAQGAGLLIDYLDRYLPRLDLAYDQHWAMGALLHVDTQLGTSHGIKRSAWALLRELDDPHWLERPPTTTTPRPAPIRPARGQLG